MRPDEIHVGHTYQGKASDSDKRRLVKSMGPATAVTQVFNLQGKDLGESILSVRTLALWAGSDVTAEMKEAPHASR